MAAGATIRPMHVKAKENGKNNAQQNIVTRLPVALTMKRMTVMAVLIFGLTVMSGPAYTVDGYNSLSNLISELGAQGTQNNYIMIFGFITLGAGILISSLTRRSLAMIPFILFGFFMVAAGIFPHKPIDATLKYNSFVHSLHSASATLAGTTITVGFIWQGVLRSQTTIKIICFYLAVICLAFPILMLNVPAYQGLIQRLMYLQVLGWLMVMHPENIMTGNSL